MYKKAYEDNISTKLTTIISPNATTTAVVLQGKSYYVIFQWKDAVFYLKNKTPL